MKEMFYEDIWLPGRKFTKGVWVKEIKNRRGRGGEGKGKVIFELLYRGNGIGG